MTPMALWRFAWARYGAESAMILGTLSMLKWSVDNLDTWSQVRQLYRPKVITLQSYIYLILNLRRHVGGYEPSLTPLQLGHCS